MNSRPLLFTGENIRAIYKNRKTMTRRVIRPQPSDGGLDCCTAGDGEFSAWQDPGLLLEEHSEDGGPCQRICPYGVTGDLLWVRETWGAWPYAGGGVQLDSVRYRATDNPPEDLHNAWRWRPSIHMPRELSRLTLRIINVRVERVQDITPKDCVAEGIRLVVGDVGKVMIGENMVHGTPRPLFERLWDSINGPRGFWWKDNYWVWVVEWDKVWEKNVDEVIKELAT